MDCSPQFQALIEAHGDITMSGMEQDFPLGWGDFAVKNSSVSARLRHA
jgi:hypothetical protein